jgi:hypothetical protein
MFFACVFEYFDIDNQSMKTQIPPIQIVYGGPGVPTHVADF